MLPERRGFLGGLVNAVELVLSLSSDVRVGRSALIASSADVPPVVLVLPGVLTIWALEWCAGINFRHSGLRPRASSKDVPKDSCLLRRVLFKLLDLVGGSVALLSTSGAMQKWIQ